ncbi:MAG TPA: KUP/HAK/KT family potassium transporter, partial [Chthonomonadaceae bacterium]|nr:KUP/HAK/KT family potassium transporter [Chthonomonadaceae bacterium]
VVLAVTGAEALYADRGHFGATPIRLGWLGIAFPALMLNYLGQAAMILHDPSTASNPFFLMAPHWSQYPMLFLATAATIIASQAAISGSFSVAKQAVQLGFLPRLKVLHTSKTEGQIYVPIVNLGLCIGVIALTLVFRSADKLGDIYGVAVTGTFILNTILFVAVARLMWRTARWKLALLAGLFLVSFGGETHALLPLYTVGVFIAFTLSQGGMVSRWWRQRQFGWRLIINLIGCTITGIVLVVVASSKFWVTTPAATLFRIGTLPVQEGAWIALLLMSLLFLMFRGIHRHYQIFDQQMAVIPAGYDRPFKHTVIVLVPSRIHRGIVLALNYARSLSPDALAVHISFDPSREQRLRDAWAAHGGDTPLLILDSPYRTLIGPLLRYLDAAENVRSDDIITVIIPEFVPARWWQHFLHNASGWLIRLILFYRRDIVLASVRYYLDE